MAKAVTAPGNPGELTGHSPAERSCAPNEWSRLLRRRMRQITGDRSCRQIGEDTDTHPETVRRYLTTGTRCARFIAALCRTYGADARWLLLGADPTTHASMPSTIQVTVALEVTPDQSRVTACAASQVLGAPARPTGALSPFSPHGTPPGRDFHRLDGPATPQDWV